MKGLRLPELIFEDDKCLAKDAVSAFRRLADEQKVSLIVGPACSTSIQSVAPVAKRSSIPVLFLLDTGESVSSVPDPLYSFGFDPPKMAHLLADDLYKRDLKSVGLVTEEEEYSVLISKAFEEEWRKLGGTIKASESLPVNSTDFRPTITKIVARKPDAIFFSSAYQQ
jgi:branched-chain amino acid transport system substrate-binding protein